ncbi:MAG: tRNA (guanosine(46)-N7)-methyltransferase TrmB [Elainellaceae cyanobacterium]
MAIPRVRQHVNPLSDRYSTPTAPPQWDSIYGNPTQPLLLDIGCARGTFLLEMAQQQPQRNFLGLEIRAALVEDALNKRGQLGLTNLHFMFCNVTPSLSPLLASLPMGVLDQVTIQFPDPWFKKRHQKRRVVQPALVEAIATALTPGGFVFLQSDVKSVVLEMGERFSRHDSFMPHNGWVESPFPVLTEREAMTLERGEPVYRLQFDKQN